MTYTDDRQAGDENKEGVPQIEVTPEMVYRGVKALLGCVAIDDLRSNHAEDVVMAIYEAMATPSQEAGRQTQTACHQQR